MAHLATPHPEGTYRVLPTPKRVRARVGGRFIADSDRAKLVIYGDPPHPRSYAFPSADVDLEALSFGKPRQDDRFGTVRPGDLKVDGRRIQDAARRHEDGELADHVALRWDALDAWYEEDEEVFVHPRDPFHRIDVLRSSRHVVVEVDGTRVAESRSPALLFETGLPVRYYLPQTDVRLDLLRPSEKTTACPYKGFASYHHLEVEGELHDDLVWCYRAPFEGVQRIQGLFCFFQERVDLQVDGRPEERPRTPWSR